MILSSCAALTTNASEVAGTEGCDPAQTNLYEYSEGQLSLVNLLPGKTVGTTGATLAAPGGSVSTDGSRIYFTDAGNLYLREAAATNQLDETLGGGGEFQTATPNGSIAFYTKEEKLYSYGATSHSLTDLTPSGGVIGVLGASEDGSHGLLTRPPPVSDSRARLALTTKVARRPPSQAITRRPPGAQRQRRRPTAPLPLHGIPDRL